MNGPDGPPWNGEEWAAAIDAVRRVRTLHLAEQHIREGQNVLSLPREERIELARVAAQEQVWAR